MDGDLKFKQPFTSIIGGPTGSGKTSFCVKFLKNLDTQRTEAEFSGGNIWCYTEKTAVPYKGLRKLKNIHQEGLPEDFADTQGKPSLLILDDLLNQVYSEAVCDLFTKGSHHRKVSVFFLTQNVFHQGTKCRDISLNAKYLVALKNVRDRYQFSFLARQVYAENSDSLYKAYLNATSKACVYLKLDFAQDTSDRIRCRTNVFPDQYHLVLYTTVNNETHKIKFSLTLRIKKRKKITQTHTFKLTES
jgi:hypothetical protein